MEHVVGLVAVAGFLGIPLAAIIGSYIIKYKKLQMMEKKGPSTEDARMLKAIIKENVELRQRVANLEEIVTGNEQLLNTHNH